MRELKNYSDYKNYIGMSLVGTSMSEYAPNYKPLFDLLHAYPEIEFDNDELADIRDSIFDHVYFKLYTLDNPDKNKVLLRLKNSLKLLTKTIEEVLDAEIELIKKEEDDLRDPFIDDIRREETFNQVTAIELSGISKNTIQKHREAENNVFFISNGASSINVRSFANWLKHYDYESYKSFKEKYSERYK